MQDRHRHLDEISYDARPDHTMGHERLGRAGRKSGYVRYDNDQIFQRSGMSRMGWTGRARAPNGCQSLRGACQEKEHRHASHDHRSRSDHHRNRYG
jgi:hypothetical protein